MQAASPFDSLLAESRDLISTRLFEALAGMLEKGDEALCALEIQSRERAAKEVYSRTRKTLSDKRTVFETQFRVRYLKEFQQRASHASNPDESLPGVDFSSLELVGKEDLEETLRFNDMATRLRRHCDEELAALDQRVGVLLGDANLDADANPFSPQAICDAYKQVCRQIDPDVEVRKVLLKLFDDHVADAVRSVYKSVNELLVRNSILPKIRYGVSPDKTPSKGPRAAEKDGQAEQTNAGAEENVFSVLQALLAKGKGAGSVAGSNSTHPVVQGPELLNSLTRIQQGDVSGLAGASAAQWSETAATENVVRQLKSTQLGTGLSDMDAMTLDIVAMLFDELFDDPKIPVGVKGLIGRMQIPVLKVAIADKSFFSNKSHPARALMDAIGELAAQLPPNFGTSEPLFAPLEKIVQEVLDGFKDDVAVFDTARGRLRALLAEAEQHVEREAQAAAQQAEEMEKLAFAKAAAQQEVSARIQATALPGPILEFIVQQWLKLLLVVHAKRGKASDAWKNGLEVMDDLVWSVQPKGTMEERKKLAVLIPRLLKRIAAGLKAAGIADDIRERFFADLMGYHTEIMSAGANDKTPANGSAKGVERSAAATATSDFTQNITVRNPFGTGEVQVEPLPAAETPAQLSLGAWIGLQEEAGKARPPARLIFISPRHTRYIFARDGKGKDVFVWTRAELTRRLRAGEAVMMKEAPKGSLFDRLMGDVMGKLGRMAAH
jgi:hypothetical protein